MNARLDHAIDIALGRPDVETRRRIIVELLTQSVEANALGLAHLRAHDDDRASVLAQQSRDRRAVRRPATFVASGFGASCGQDSYGVRPLARRPRRRRVQNRLQRDLQRRQEIA
jgi:hypothetical protein